jgi:hypothetical protein
MALLKMGTKVIILSGHVGGRVSQFNHGIGARFAVGKGSKMVLCQGPLSKFNVLLGLHC